MNEPLDDVTDSKADALIDDALRTQRERQLQRRDAAIIAVPALYRLVDVMRHKTGQGYKLRAFLYSMFNGKPASLLEALGLDWPIRQDLALVWLGFGYEDPGRGHAFFYDALKDAVSSVHLWAWFIEEGKEVKP
jgi:hypothetical protein